MAGVTQPKVSRVAPPELVAWAQSGRIRVPQFQRSYRWDSEDAERLFDSIFRGYPIGNLLMWRKPAPAAEISLGELRFTAPERSDALWVVDGQQRLTTLIGALTASEETVDRRFRIFYVPYYFLLMNIAAAAGICGTLAGRRFAVWTPERPSAELSSPPSDQPASAKT